MVIIPDSDFDTETRILLAAEKEFMNKGFSGARTTSIAEAAGVTHAMLHYYFRTKEKLFEKILSQKIGLLKDVFLSSIGDITLPIENIVENIVGSHLDFINANPDLPRFILSEIHSNPERMEYFRSIVAGYSPILFSTLQQKINTAADEGRCRRVDARMLILDIISLNIFPYLAFPILSAAMKPLISDSEEFMKLRKKENYETIMRKLKP